jgi:hypothetical protein
MLGTLKKYLSTPLASALSLLLAVLIKLGLIRSFLEIGNDLLLTVVTTRHWLQGYGISILSSEISDLARSAYVPYTGWPPGIHLQLAPFLLVCGDDLVRAIFLLMMVVTIFFFLILKELLRLIGFPAWLANLFLLFQSLILGKMLLISNPTDYTGLIWLLGSLLFIGKGLYSQKPLGWHILSLFFLILAGLTRYQYVAVVVLLGVAVVLLGIMNKKRTWIRQGLLLTAVTSFILIAVIAVFVSQVSADFYLMPLKRGFYARNVLHTYPFMLSSFLNVELFTIQLSKIMHLPYRTVVGLFTGLNYMLVALFLGYMVYWFARYKWKAESFWETFKILGGFTSLVTIAVIFLLSFILGTQLEPLLGNWTFVMEARYFAFPVLFLQIFLWRLLFVDPGTKKGFRFFRPLLIFFVLIWMTHGCYVLLRKVQGLVPMEDVPFKEEEIVFVKNTILANQQSRPEKRLVFTGVNKLVCYTANWYGVPALYQPLTLNQLTPAASKETVLIVGVRKRHKYLLKEFLMRKDISLIFETDQFEFYSLHIEPKKEK